MFTNASEEFGEIEKVVNSINEINPHKDNIFITISFSENFKKIFLVVVLKDVGLMAKISEFESIDEFLTFLKAVLKGEKRIEIPELKFK